MARIIGIDLGTTMSVVAVMEGGQPIVVTNEEGERLTPSVVAWDPKGQVLVGTVARRQSIVNPGRTVYSAKRFIGRRFEEIGEETRRVPFKVARAPNGDAWFDVEGRHHSPAEISSHVLAKLRRAAESYLSEKVSEAVVTVPAYFNDSQRQSTKDAGRIAGLDVKRIINEPTAAALAYGLDKKGEERIAVYDFGGGTFDISILEVSQGLIEVVATNGDTHLGGDDLDARVVDYIANEFRQQTGLDITKDRMALQRVRDAAEKARVELSSVTETEVNLPFLSADAAGPKHLSLRLSRAKLEQLIGDLIERSFGPVRQALADAKKTPADIDEVVLVGGVTRTPLLQRRVREVFGKEPNRGVNPDEVVALGAAVQAGILGGEVRAMVLLDVTPLSLGVETLGGVSTVLIPRNTTIPTRKAEVFTTAADSQNSVEIHVVQGERSMAHDNRSLGKFHLVGIPPAPRGVPQIEVAFDIDANGILNVSARDKATTREQRIQITASGGLSKDDVERLAREAEAHGAEDERRKQATEARNRLDTLAYTTRRTLDENRARLPAGLADEVGRALAEAQRMVDARSEELDEIKRAEADLTRAAHRMAEELYRAAGGAPGGGGGGGGGGSGGGPEGEVVEAEYEEHPPPG
ncbi:MAG: molecular chaperone DnaK [Pseudomonadota bacterium]